MDESDRSFNNENARVEARIKCSSNYRSGLSPAGRCHSCDETVDNHKLYCDNLCADDHAKNRDRRILRH